MIRKSISALFPALAMLIALATAAQARVGAQRVEVTVKGMVCSACSQGLLKIAARDPRIDKSSITMEKRQFTLLIRSGAEMSDAEIRKLVEDAGLEVGEIKRDDS